MKDTGMLTRYLIEYDFSSYEAQNLPRVPMRVGVTAYSLEDALNLVAQWVLPGDEWPPPKCVTADYDLGLEEQPWGKREMALRTVGVTVRRGVWLPCYNLLYGADDGHNLPFRPEARKASVEDLELYIRCLVSS